MKNKMTLCLNCKLQTIDSCLGLIGPRQCSVALGGPATSTHLAHQKGFKQAEGCTYIITLVYREKPGWWFSDEDHRR